MPLAFRLALSNDRLRRAARIDSTGEQQQPRLDTRTLHNSSFTAGSNLNSPIMLGISAPGCKQCRLLPLPVRYITKPSALADCEPCERTESIERYVQLRQLTPDITLGTNKPQRAVKKSVTGYDCSTNSFT